MREATRLPLQTVALAGCYRCFVFLRSRPHLTATAGALLIVVARHAWWGLIRCSFVRHRGEHLTFLIFFLFCCFVVLLFSCCGSGWARVILWVKGSSLTVRVSEKCPHL